MRNIIGFVCLLTSQGSASRADEFEPRFVLDVSPLVLQQSYLSVTLGCYKRYRTLHPRSDFADFWNVVRVRYAKDKYKLTKIFRIVLLLCLLLFRRYKCKG